MHLHCLHPGRSVPLLLDCACIPDRDDIAALIFAARLQGAEVELPSAAQCVPCELQPQLRPAGSEQLGPVTRGSILRTQPPEIPRTRQQQLDDVVGVGRYVVDEEKSVAACLRCSRFKRQTINLLHPAWMANAVAHHATHPNKQHRHAHT